MVIWNGWKQVKLKLFWLHIWKNFPVLTGLDITEIKERNFELVKSFAQEYQVILLLKGHTTIVSDGKETYTISYGGAGMATSGSGDVLSGILAGMLAYQDFNLLTISAGVLLNGLAGEIAQEKNTDIGMIASDTVQCIPEAIKKILKWFCCYFSRFLEVRYSGGNNWLSKGISWGKEKSLST